MDRPLQTQQDSIRLAVYQDDEITLPGGTYGGGLGQAYVNCFPVVQRNADTGEGVPMVVKREGTTAIADLSISALGTADTMVCIYNMVMTQLYDVYVAAFFDGTSGKIHIVMYRPGSASAAVKIGTLVDSVGSELTSCSATDAVFITEITNGDTLLPAIAVSYQKADQSSGTGYYAVTSGGVFTAASLTRISHASFPSNLATPRIITGPFQYMNGHNYIMTLDGFIYMSSLTSAGNPDVTTWNTNATVTATQEPDGGVGLFRYKHHLLAFGKDSVEFFNDASNPPPGSTLERTDQAFIRFGAISPKLIQNFDDTIYWVAYGSNNSFGVWKMDGYVPVKISTPKIDNMLINGLQGTNQFNQTMQCIVLGGRKHVILNGFVYFTSPTFMVGSGSDTYSLTPGFTSRCHAVAYNLDDKVWWGFNLLSSYQFSYVMPTTSFKATSQQGNYRQYFFMQPQSSSGGGNDVSSCRVLYFNIGGLSAGKYVDVNPTFGIDAPICMTMALNPYWFETERRKRVNKIKVIVDGLTTVDANVYAMYICQTPDNLFDSAGTTIISRRIVIPTADQRYYDNNWGMHRCLNLAVVCTSKDDMRIRGIEVDVAQGTS